MTTPVPTSLGLRSSFGFGDRLGLATPGHLTALRQAGKGICPIFAQQSIREMTRTGRSPSQVMADAMSALRHAGFTGTHGADADHLKSFDDLDRTAAAGFTFFTLDPSADVDAHADTDSDQVIAEKFNTIAGEMNWMNQYLGQTVALRSGAKIHFSEAVCRRAAVKYGRAIATTIRLAAHLQRTCERFGKPCEIELSVDETPQPTTTAEHFIFADQCLRSGVRLVSLAPRFPGDFEKGVDFKGDLARLQRAFIDHAAIARMLGPYKLSLHSGSDKLSIYPALAKATGGMFHVKTAGTSYLEAVRVAAQVNGPLFRRIIELARSRYETDRATYHVSATLDAAPAPTPRQSDRELERQYLGLWSEVPNGCGFTCPGRQILHCTFGSVLCDPRLGDELRQTIRENLPLYTDLLAEHFDRHLTALHAGMK